MKRHYVFNMHIFELGIMEEAIELTGVALCIDPEPMPVSIFGVEYENDRPKLVGKFFSVYYNDGFFNIDWLDFWKTFNEVKLTDKWRTYHILVGYI